MPKLITVGQIIDKSWIHYTTHFVELISISAWLLLIVILTTVSTWLYPSTAAFATSGLSVIQVIAIIVYAITFLLLTPIVSIWIYNTLIRSIHLQATGKKVVLSKVSREGWKYFFPRIWVGILVGVVMLSTILFVAPGILINFGAIGLTSSALGAIGSIVTFLGIVTTIIVAIFLATKLAFSSYSVVLDDYRGVKALKHSAKITQGKWWATFWRLTIPKVLIFFGFFVAQILLVYLLRLIILNVVGLNVMLGARLFTISSQVIFLILTILMNPLILIVDYYVYKGIQGKIN